MRDGDSISSGPIQKYLPQANLYCIIGTSSVTSVADGGPYKPLDIGSIPIRTNLFREPIMAGNACTRRWDHDLTGLPPIGFRITMQYFNIQIISIDKLHDEGSYTVTVGFRSKKREIARGWFIVDDNIVVHSNISYDKVEHCPILYRTILLFKTYIVIRPDLLPDNQYIPGKGLEKAAAALDLLV